MLSLRHREFSTPVNILIALAMILGALFLWELRYVLILLFMAVIAAVILRSVAEILEKYTPLNGTFSLLVGGLIIAGIVAAFFFLIGTQILTQMVELFDELPQRLADIGEGFGFDNLDRLVGQQFGETLAAGGVVAGLFGYTYGIVGAVTTSVLVIVAGIYLATDVHLYRTGVLKLVPEKYRDKAEQILDKSGRALKLWLLGQLASMTAIGIAITIALLFIDMPSALALGFIAAVLEFVPYLGPVLSAIPAVLIALTLEPHMIWWVLFIYVVVQQLEHNILVPIIQRRTVDLPPVLGLFSLVGFGVLFGTLGIFVATPLTVVLMVAIKQLYMRDTLHVPTSVPGDTLREKVREERKLEEAEAEAAAQTSE